MHLWPFMPQREFIESLEWKTDVIRCKGAEQRQALRAVPRSGYQFGLVLSPRQLGLAKLLARAAGAQEVLLPLWGELTNVSALSIDDTEILFDTRFAHYALGAPILIWQDEEHWEVRDVAVLTATGVSFAPGLEKSYTSPLVAPLRAVRFAQAMEVSRGAMEYARGQVWFEATEGTDLSGSLGYPVYLGHDVVIDRSFLISDISERFERESSEVDNGTGPVWVGPRYTYPIQTSVMAWDVLSREELWNLRLWLHSRRGKWRGFWFPSWNLDLEVAQPLAAADTTLTIKGIGYPALEGQRDIMVQTKAGARHFFRVLSASAGLLGQEVLTISGPLGVDLPISDIDFTCFMTFMRFDADRVEIKHRAARGARVAVPVMEAPVP